MPAMLGIPVLISFLSGVITSVIGFLFQFFTKRVIQAAVFVSSFLLLVIGFVKASFSLLDKVVTILPPEISDAISLILPENAFFCISAILSIKVALFIFDVKNRVITLLAS